MIFCQLPTSNWFFAEPYSVDDFVNAAFKKNPYNLSVATLTTINYTGLVENIPVNSNQGVNLSCPLGAAFLSLLFPSIQLSPSEVTAVFPVTCPYESPGWRQE